MLQLNCQCILLTAAVVAGCHGNVSVFILALASCGFLLISSKRFQSIDDLPVHSRQGSLLPCPSEWSSLLRTRLVVAVSFRVEQFAQDEARCCRVLQSGAVCSGRGSLLPCPSERSSSLRARLVVAVSFRVEQFAQDKARCCRVLQSGAVCSGQGSSFRAEQQACASTAMSQNSVVLVFFCNLKQLEMMFTIFCTQYPENANYYMRA